MCISVCSSFKHTTHHSMMNLLQMDSLLQEMNSTHFYGMILAILILSIHVRLKSGSSRKLRTPPEVAGTWPIMGHMPILGKSHLPYRTFVSMADKYGPIFTIRLRLFPAIVVSSSEIAKECFTKHDLVLASRPQQLATEVMGYNYAFLKFTRYGPYWRLFPVADALPFLGWLDLGGQEKSMKSTAKEWDTILNFMDVMLSTLEGMDIGGFDSDTIIKATCKALAAGATDTTITTITRAMSLLLNNRHALKKTQEALNAQIGKERHVKESDISNLTYLHAIGDLQLRKIQTDPRAWLEPMEFRPERFLNSHKKIDVKDPFEYLPFGGGRRICLRMSFGIQSVHSMLARFLHAFKVATPDNLPVDMSEGTGITIAKAMPIEVMLTPRLPNKVYKFT
ncbi:hypothetical protein EUGRSUZ_L00958 [Eucalyptus grandis]|uniref:Cytochrome P450 n=1 Tax=Eucalyptus grandis TaxID=71139 RepID=A0A058ZWF6_EUCGR|nr:hypothetical protein EUGRSUZ_L00958 [Eucalyptus grandis]